MKARKSDRTTENPTLEDIRRRCSKIQADWSEKERLKRAGCVPTQWQPPTILLADYDYLDGHLTPLV